VTDQPGAALPPVAYDAASGIRVDLRPAPPIRLHAGGLVRADANSPAHRHEGRFFLFFSHYEPIGHSYRRVGADLATLGPPEPARLIGDDTPGVGKWIESTWRDPAGRLYGWFHGEVPIGSPRLFVPHLGALASDDDGATWRLLGTLLRAPDALTDTGFRNGFLAGGYGDPCVLPDHEARFIYIHCGGYVADEALQGVVALRYPVAARDDPAGAMEAWRDGGWRPLGGGLPTPFLPVERGWRHRDPCAFWGPAIHYNRHIDSYVMLLNRTAHGEGDMRQEGIYAAFNRRLDDPSGWSAPVCVMKGGGWYPQVIGVGRDDGDTTAGAAARFFFCGYSAWLIHFAHTTAPAAAPQPPRIDDGAFEALFGRPGKGVVS